MVYMLLDHCCGSNDGSAAMTAGFSRKTLQTLISASWDPRTVYEILWSRSWQFVDCRGMLNRKSKGFSRKSPHIKKVAWSVHAIMRWHSQRVGWSGYRDSSPKVKATFFQSRFAVDLDWSGFWFARGNQLAKDLALSAEFVEIFLSCPLVSLLIWLFSLLIWHLMANRICFKFDAGHHAVMVFLVSEATLV